MKIAVLGGTGTIGKGIVHEALSRGHTVTATARHALGDNAERLRFASADVSDSEAVARAIRGHDAVVSAIGPRSGSPASLVVDASRSIAAACMKTEIKRVVIVNGAGSLAVKPGVELLSSPGFPAGWREIAIAHREALEVWRKVKELDWTVVSPAQTVSPGARTGRYRVGHNDLLLDDQGQSRISVEDYAVGILDELENSSHLRERITLAY